LRSFEQFHARAFRSAITLAIVAGSTAGDQIIPSRIAALTPRHYMIERKFLWRKDAPAILTGVVIAQKYVFTRETLSLEWNVNVFDQSDY